LSVSTVQTSPAPAVQPVRRKASDRMSYTALTLHRECPQAWSYRYVRGLTEISDARFDPDLGSWWHALRAADSIRRGAASGTLRYAPDDLTTTDNGPRFRLGDGLWAQDGSLQPAPRPTLIVGRTEEDGAPVVMSCSAKTVLIMCATWWETLTPETQEAWTEHIGGRTLPVQLAEMNAGYLRRWEADLENEEVIGVEVWFERAIPHATDGAVVPGKVDEIYRDKRRGLIVSRDHKTNRTIEPMESTIDSLDPQNHLYAWGANELVRAWLGEPISALSYDRVRSTAPKLPQLTATGTLSKAVTDYDLQTYEEWAAGSDGEGIPWGELDTYVASGKNQGKPKFGVYTAEEAVLAKLRSPSWQTKWYDRTLTPVNKNIVLAHLIAASDTWAAAAASEYRFLELGFAARNLTRQRCKRCPFNELCLAEMVGGPGGDYPLTEMGLTHRKSRG
jgi:hypothetical protein